MQPSDQTDDELRVLSFNILYGGGQAAGVGFPNSDFGGSRIDEIADVIRQSKAQIVGIQEDAGSNALLDELNKQQPRWFRYGNIYSQFPLQGLQKTDKAFGMSVCRVQIAKTRWLTVINTHWYPSPYGPDLLQKAIKENPDIELAALRKAVLKKSHKAAGYRGYNETLQAIKLAPAGEPIVMTGDFNEPSHLDWTERFARNGFDRWHKNSTSVPLNMAMPWAGSQLLQQAGLADAYRRVHTNEVSHPGATFTPAYPPGTPGRKPIADQVHARIDRIYFSPQHMKVVDAKVIGEKGRWSDTVYASKWPSDHRAVLATFRLQLKSRSR